MLLIHLLLYDFDSSDSDIFQANIVINIETCSQKEKPGSSGLSEGGIGFEGGMKSLLLSMALLCLPNLNRTLKF